MMASEALFMSEKSVRFGVRTDNGLRAATWKCWTPGKGKSDLYLACRALGGELKASFHESGKWHIAYSHIFHQTRFDDAHRPKTRFTETWNCPENQAAIIAYRIVVPWFSPTIPPEQEEPDIHWLPCAPEGLSVVVTIAITKQSFLIERPEVFFAPTKVLDTIALSNGDIAWILHEITMTELKKAQSKNIRYYKDAQKLTANDEGLRTIIFGDMQDGTKVMVDVPIVVKEVTDEGPIVSIATGRC
jgi:hypothetical protein